MISQDKFRQVTAMVIKNLEGGYYHPNMLKDGRVKDTRYSSSGETMYGIDRKQGGTINTSPAGLKFWKLIDDANARNTWRWNYLGGDLAPSLINLVGDMMKPQFEALLTRYGSPKLIQAIEADDRLLFNFIYAAWNGSGWFAKWAKDLNAYLDKGTRTKDEILNFALNLRTTEGYSKGSKPNSLIKQGGDKIKGFINSLFKSSEEAITEGVEVVKKNPINTTLIVLAVAVIAFIVIKYN